MACMGGPAGGRRTAVGSSVHSAEVLSRPGSRVSNFSRATQAVGCTKDMTHLAQAGGVHALGAAGDPAPVVRGGVEGDAGWVCAVMTRMMHVMLTGVVSMMDGRDA